MAITSFTEIDTHHDTYKQIGVNQKLSRFIKLQQIIPEMGHCVLAVAVGDRSGTKPFNYRIFDRVGKEVVAGRVVVTDVVTCHVIFQRQVEAFVIFNVDEVHIEIKDLIVAEIIYDGLIATFAGGDKLSGDSRAVERDHQLFVSMLGKC